MSNTEICFFDVDYTITKASTGIRFIFNGFKEKVLPFSTFIYFPATYIAYKFGFLNENKLRIELPFLKGITKKELIKIANSGFKNYIKKDIFPKADNYIKELIKNNKEIVLASSSVDFMLRPLADYYGIKDIIASSFEFNGEISACRFKDEPAFKNAKLKKVKEYLKERNIDIQNCSFYSDSFHDLPLLKAVGKPVAVNPDRRLKKYAIEKNWEILIFKK